MRRDGRRRTGTQYRHLHHQPPRQGPGNAARPGAVPARPRRLHPDARGADRLRGNPAPAGLAGGVPRPRGRHPRPHGRRAAGGHVRQDRHQPGGARGRGDPPFHRGRARGGAEPARGLDPGDRARRDRRQLPDRHHPRASQLGQPGLYRAVRGAHAALLRRRPSAVRRRARQAELGRHPRTRLRRARLPFAQPEAHASRQAHAQRDRLGPGIGGHPGPVGQVPRLPARPLRRELRARRAHAGDRAAALPLSLPLRQPVPPLAAAVAGRAAVPGMPGRGARGRKKAGAKAGGESQKGGVASGDTGASAAPAKPARGASRRAAAGA